MTVAALMCGCLLLLAMSDPFAFVAGKGAGTELNAKQDAAVQKYTQMTPPTIAEEAPIVSQPVAAFLAATLCGICLGFANVQAATAGGQALQNLGQKTAPRGTTWKERMAIELASKDKAQEEFRMDYNRIKAGLEADPKEKRVADAMKHMRAIAAQELARTEREMTTAAYNPSFM